MATKSLPASMRTRLAVLSMKDDEFRKALVADPMTTVRTNFGLPEGVSLRVVEADPATACIVIPRRPSDWPADISASDALDRLKKVLAPRPEDLPARAEGVLSVIGRAMVDEEYAATLVGNPHSALREAGVPVPDGVEVMVLQETESESVLIVRPNEPGVGIADAELEAASVLQDSLMQTEMTDGSWPFKCSNPPTWCPSCLKN